LFGPLAILITAASLIFVPQIRRSTDSVAAQWRRMLISSVFMSLLGLATVAVLLSIPDSVGKLILGEVWQPAMSVVPYMGISCVAIAWLVSGYSMLAAQGNSAALLRVHIIQVVLIVIFCAIGGLVLKTAGGIAIGEAVAGWVAVVVVLTVVTRLVNRLSSEDAAPNQDTEREATLSKVLP
jgi:O-antigen/teichoic acid export membrane protein